MTLVSGEDEVLKFETEAVKKLVLRKLEEKNINIVLGGVVSKITAEGVELIDGRFLPCNVPVWATGAEP